MTNSTTSSRFSTTVWGTLPPCSLVLPCQIWPGSRESGGGGVSESGALRTSMSRQPGNLRVPLTNIMYSQGDYILYRYPTMVRGFSLSNICPWSPSQPTRISNWLPIQVGPTCHTKMHEVYLRETGSSVITLWADLERETLLLGTIVSVIRSSAPLSPPISLPS